MLHRQRMRLRIIEHIRIRRTARWRAERPAKKSPARRGAEVKEARVGLSRLLRSISSGWRALKSATTPVVTFGVRVAPARDEPRSGSNNSERGPTSGRSTNYASGHLIRVFRDIGRIFSLLFLLQHPSPVGQPLKGRGSRNMVSSKAKTVSIVCRAELNAVDEPAACRSPKREPRPRAR
jgi:hypothetical protein